MYVCVYCVCIISDVENLYLNNLGLVTPNAALISLPVCLLPALCVLLHDIQFCYVLSGASQLATR